jgi:hypothetical protein
MGEPEDDDMTSTLQLRKVRRLMGFRRCPACDRLLFAAEAAALTKPGDIVLRWSCDACDHTFKTREKPIPGRAHAVAA